MQNECRDVCGEHGLVVYKLDQQALILAEIRNDTKATLAMHQSNAMDIQSLKDDRALRNKIIVGIVTFIGANLGALWAWVANKN